MKVQSRFYPGDFVTREGDREIRSVSRRLPDYPGELACMKWKEILTRAGQKRTADMNPEGEREGLAEDRSLTNVPLRLSNERGILNDRRIYSLFTITSCSCPMRT